MIPFPSSTRFEYACVPLWVMLEVATVPTQPNAYVSCSPEGAKVRELLGQGYRWVRTENDQAVLELQIDRS